MKVRASDDFNEALEYIPEPIKKKLYKQLRFLGHNLMHPSLHAKKYDEARNIWQARVDKSWRFYFQIKDDTYLLLDIIPHPK